MYSIIVVEALNEKINKVRISNSYFILPVEMVSWQALHFWDGLPKNLLH